MTPASQNRRQLLERRLVRAGLAAVLAAACNIRSDLAQATIGEETSWREVRRSVGERPVVTRFFATWSGLEHPYTPRTPIDFIAAQALDVYYQASYEMIAGRERLVRFDKLALKRRAVDLQVPPELRDSTFLMLDTRSSSAASAFRPLAPPAAIEADDYLFRNADGSLARLFRTVLWSVAYEYSRDGAYTRHIELVPDPVLQN